MFRDEVVAVPEALAGMRGSLFAWLGAAGVPDTVAADAVLAASEAAGNAVEHANSGAGGVLVVSASITGGELELSVEDRGSWRDPSVERTTDRGRGFLIMRGLMDDVAVHKSSAGTRVQLSRRFERRISPCR